MIFSPELADKVLAGHKTVTRRPIRLVPNLQPDGWDGRRDGMVAMPCRYQVGRTYAVQPGRGKKGIGRVRILSITEETLGHILAAPWGETEAAREGFNGTGDFSYYWEQLYGRWDASTPVWRIEFEVAGD